jgi:perosamine synthetase
MSDKKKILKKIYLAISKVTKKKAQLHEPYFSGNEWKYVKKCLDSSYVSSVGGFVNKFEKDFEKFTDAKYCIAVSSGTAALHLALSLVGVKENDEVLLPSINYVSSSNAILYCKADPHFVEVEKNTLGVDVKKLRDYLKKNTTRKRKKCINRKTKKIIKAIIPLHTFGHPCNINEIILLAKEFNLKVIEDAAEGVGSLYKKKHVGTFGDIGILSFNGNKTITTGGGGLLMTNNNYFAKKAKHISNNSKIYKNFQISHDQIGHNYRMPNINAAIGCAQLEKISTLINAKRKLFEMYKKEFIKLNEVKVFKEPRNCRSNYWLQTILLNEKNKNLKNSIIKYCNKRNKSVRPVWKLMHKLKYLSKYQKMNLLVSENLEKKIINLPSSSAILLK